MEPGFENSSPLAGIAPETLLLAAGGAAVCVSLLHSYATLCASLLLALLLVIIRRPPLASFLKAFFAANFFVLFLWATLPLTVPGEPLASVGFLVLSREGAALALSATFRCNAILLCFLALVSDLSLAQIGCSLERLRVPPKLVFLFLFTCRYIHVIGDEWRRLQTAARLRGFVPKTSMHTYRTIGNMLGLTVINSLARARRVYEAMLLRGFNGNFHTLAELRGASAGSAFPLLFFLILFCLLAADICLRLADA